MHQDSGDRFVNPYTFVPFSTTEPHRTSPHGHAGDQRLWSGVLHLTITAHSPVLVRMDKPEPGEPPQLPSRPGGPSGTPQEIIPGSSLHGAARSLHETLTGSCLRVFDSTFLPVYRDIASNTADLRLAVVRRVDQQGRPTEFQLCAPGDVRNHRIRQDVLERHQGLASGTELRVVQDQSGKIVDAAPAPGGGWIVFISDAGARDPQLPYHAAVRRLTNETVPGPSQEVWQEYLTSVEGADDLRPANQRRYQSQSTLVDVTFTYKPKHGSERKIVVGRRYRASPVLIVGQPVWVRLDSAQHIVRIQLGQIWRHSGQYTAGERLPRGRYGGLLACSTSDWLCPSCRLFGSVDTREDGVPRPSYADQQSYRGHVRFSDAVPIGPVTPLAITLPPQSSPRPGAGQFYLASPSDLIGNASRPPLREWGAKPDKPPNQPRRLRGRKFYWHTPGNHQERGIARKHHIDEHPDQVQPVMAFPAGTRFTATITLIDVDEVQLGSVIATLQPGAVFGRDDLMGHLGGGRPLGYGSCTISIETDQNNPTSQLWRSGSRYRKKGPGDTLDLSLASNRQKLLQAFLASKDRADQQTWRSLATVLRRDAVPASLVWYPPGRGWKERATLTDKFDEGFEFWKQTSGHRLADKEGVRQGYPFTTLPAVTDNDQSTPIVTGEAAIKPLPGKDI